MDTSTVRLRIASQTDIGRNPSRSKNEDFLGQFEGDYGRLFIVCDGMGGHAGGDIASRLVVESVHKYFETSYIPGNEQDAIAQSVDFVQERLQEAVRTNPDLTGMGTTLVLLLIKDINYWYAHCGDSRLYLSRNGALHQLTKDHSEVQSLVDSGVITEDQASTHPNRGFVTRAIGGPNHIPDIAGPYKLQQDDVFLLCTDGLTEYVKNRELLQQMREEPMIACVNLVEMANDRGGGDNITALIVQVQQCTPFKLSSADAPVSRKRKKKLPPLGIVAAVVVFGAAVILYATSLRRAPRVQGAPTQTEEVAKTETVAKEPKQIKAKKVKAPKKPKVKKSKDKTAKTQGQQAQPSAQIESSVDELLGAREPIASYQELVTKLGSKLRLKFITNPKDNQLVYILPGQAIYIAYNELQARDKYNMPRDQIEALIALAVQLAQGKAPLAGNDWMNKLQAPGIGSVDPGSFDAARELYKKADPVNAEALFNSAARFGKYQRLITPGTFSLSIELPKAPAP